jgi:ADP-heptose:LPS heptosyltransferase
VTLKTWEKRGKRVLTRGLGRVLRVRPEAGAPPDLAGLRSILLVRPQNQFGDMLLASPLFRAVRERAPGARIDLVAGDANVDAARGNRHLDEVLLYDKQECLRRPHRAKRFADRLRDARYDLALVSSTVSFSMTSAWLAVLSGARRRAGRPGPGGRGAGVASDLYHWVLPEPIEGRHQTGVNLDLAAPFGVAGEDWTPEIHLTPDEVARGRRLLEEALGPPGGSSRIVLHPGAGKAPNRWPAERFGEVGAALLAEGHRVVVTTGPRESGLYSRVNAGAGARLPRLPATDVRTLGGAIRAADFLLANDTGVLHLGAATGTPALGLFGPTDPAIWCPAAPTVRWLRAPDGDLSRLEVDAVRVGALAFAAARGGLDGLPRELAAPPGSPA